MKKLLQYFLWIFLVFFFLIYNIIFSAFFWNNYIKKYINEIYKNNIIFDYTIQDISIFRGLEIDNISIYEVSTNSYLLNIKKIKIKYFLPGILIGNFGIKEIFIVEPKIYLLKINDKWNIDSLIPPPEEPQQEVSAESKIPEIINLYMPLKLFFYFNIQNLELVLKEIQIIKNKEVILQQLEIRNLSMYFGIITKEFSKVPINYTMFSLVDDFIFFLNPYNNFSLFYQKNYKINGNPKLKIQLYKIDSSQHYFLSKIELFTSPLEIQSISNKIVLNTILNWDIKYIPEEQTFKIENIFLQNDNRYLFFLTGKFQKLENDWYLELKQKSDIENQFLLDTFGKVLVELVDKNLFLRGDIRISELEIKGLLSNLYLNLYMESKYLQYQNHTIKNFILKSIGYLDLRNIFKFLYENQNQNDNHLVFGVIKDLHLENLSLFYNNALVHLQGDIKNTINLKLNVKNFSLGQFLYPYLLGNLNGDLNIFSNHDFSNIKFSGSVYLNNTIYSVDNYFSREQNLYLNLDGAIQLKENDTNINLNVWELSARNIQDNQKFIDISGSTVLGFGHKQIYSIQLSKLNIDYLLLEKHFPVNLRSSIFPLRNLFLKGLSTKGNINLSFSKKNNYNLDLQLSLPSLHPSYIRGVFDIEEDKNFIKINQISISGWYERLILKLKGNLTQNKNSWKPDLHLYVKFQNKELSELYKGFFLKGNILMELSFLNDTLKGNLSIHDCNLQYILLCERENKSYCKYYRVEGLSLNFPFSYNLNQKFMLEYRKDQDLNMPQPNFKIQSIISNYTLDNAYFENGYYFFGDKNHHAVEGYIQFDNNILWIPYLRLFSYIKSNINNDSYTKNGDIELKGFYFNLANLELENMSLGGKFYIINFDLNSFFPKAESVFNGSVSGVIEFNGNNLKDFISNLGIKTYIYEISKDFAGFAVRIIAPTIIAAVVNNTLKIEGIDLELKNGVVYSRIRVKSPGFFSLSRLIQPSNNEIVQERIPLGEFIKRSQKEIQY